MSKKRQEKPKEKATPAVEDPIPPPIITKRLNEKSANQAIEDYQCSGNLQDDLHELCLLVGMKPIPVVLRRHPSSSSSAADGDELDNSEKQMLYSRPCLQVVFEDEEPLNIKSIKICGWKVGVMVSRMLCKICPSLSHLQTLNLWNTRLSDQIVISLSDTFPLCSNLSTVILEGNPLPEQSYHLLISKDSNITHLSLRNNRIGVEGACLIGSALSTTRSANWNLETLNLGFNCIGDAGAVHIAKGLRLNRALLSLCLCNNGIGDVGASHLAKLLCTFALTHEEIVERRRLLLDRAQTSPEPSPEERSLAAPSNSSLNTNPSKPTSREGVGRRETKKDDKTAVTKKDDPKSTKKSSEPKVLRGKAGKSRAKEKSPSVCDPEDKPSGVVEEEPEESPLLDTLMQHRDGQVLVPGGNTSLCYLNLSGNQISERPLPLFLSCLQRVGWEGIPQLSLQRNRFCPDIEEHVKIQELLSLSAAQPGQEQKEQGD